MLEVIKSEAKNKDEALNKALENLNVCLDEVYYYFLESEGGLFKGKKYTAIVTTKYAVKEYIKNFLNNLALKMGTKFNIEIMENDYGYSIVIITNDNSVIIGKDGNTLNSIQNILRQSLRSQGNFNIKVNLDISNYKAKREKHLIYEVKNLCQDVLKTKMDVKLDPMNSYERRIVHSTVSSFKNLITESEGESPNRYVVIRYKED
jgi:spoIIIJ-associated protein